MTPLLGTGVPTTRGAGDSLETARSLSLDLDGAGEVLGCVGASESLAFAAGLSLGATEGLGVAPLTTSANTKLDKSRAIVFACFMRVLSLGLEEGLLLRLRRQTAQSE